MKDNIVVILPTNLQFFNNIQDLSTSILECVDANYIVMQRCSSNKYTRSSIANQLNATLYTLEPAKLYNDTYESLVTKVTTFVNMHNITKLAIFNAYMFKQHKDELKIYANFKHFKQCSNVTLKTLEMNSLLNFDMFVMYIMLETFNIKAYNFVEDPLQLKLAPYLNVTVKQLFFHKFHLANRLPNIYAYKANSNETTWQYEYNPSQQYAYAKQLDFDLNNIKPIEDYKYIFAMGMNNGWIKRARQSRERIIKCLHTFTDKTHINYDDSVYFHFSVDNTKYFKDKNDFFLVNAKKRFNYNDYLQLLSQSRFTLIVPSMDPSFFSLRRFFEAICLGCIPLIDITCNYKAGFSYDESMIALIEQCLLVDSAKPETFKHALYSANQYYDHILNMIKQTSFMQNYFNKAFYTKYMHNAFDLTANAITA